MNEELGPDSRKARSNFNDGYYDDSDGHSEESPEPYRPPYGEAEPPLYSAYEQIDEIGNPEFPRDAIRFALRESQPPQPSAAEFLNRLDHEEVEIEQGQYFNSIKYGDQLNRGLNELRRFQEDRITEIGVQSGLTADELERRQKLSSWDDEREKWCENDEVDSVDDEGDTICGEGVCIS